MANEVVEGQLGGGLPHLSFGHGPPLVVFPGLGTTNANPTGIQRWGELRLLSPLARSFTVHRIGRKVGLKRGTTMADLARDCAEAIGAGFDAPVDVLGISRGGSLALQLTLDRPDLVRKLVVAGAAYRLSDHGTRFQRRVAELSAAGDRRGLARMNAPDGADSRLGQRIAGGLLWLAGPLFIRRTWDPSDMIATIEAEDSFDVWDRLREISAPTVTPCSTPSSECRQESSLLGLGLTRRATARPPLTQPSGPPARRRRAAPVCRLTCRSRPATDART